MEKNLAIVFPGQGSQSVGMVSEIAQHYPSVKQHFETAATVLGYDLWKLVEEGPADELNKTEKTQPALLTACYALWDIWCKQKNPEPKLLAGHSLGEYTALVCAEALDFETAVELVAKRGKLMQQAVSEGEGAMAAIVGLDDGRVEEICAKAADKEILTPANYNSIGQVVIAGHREAVNRAIELANDAGAKLAKVLQVSVPSHSLLMEPAAKQLAEALKTIEIKVPKYQIINNVDVQITHDPKAIKDALVRQLYSPVRWVEIILKMNELGINHIIECGPGRVLAGLIKRMDRTIHCQSIFDALK